MRRWLLNLLGVGRADPEALFADLARAHPGRGRYTNADRYADFRAVFLSDERGRRVLHELLSWGHMFRAGNPADSHTMAFREGERNLALRLLHTMNAEPTQPETKARS